MTYLWRDIDPVTPESIAAAKAERDRQRADVERVTGLHIADDGLVSGLARVTCLDCGWTGIDAELLAQACPRCDGRCADC